MPDNLRVGDKVKTKWGNVYIYTVASFTPIGDVSIGEVPGIFSPEALTLVIPKWEVGDRGEFSNEGWSNSVKFTVLDFRPDGTLITDDVMEGCGVQCFPPGKCTRIAIATDETRDNARSFYKGYWIDAHAVTLNGYEFRVEHVRWARGDNYKLVLQDAAGNSYPAHECTKIDKPEPIETPPEMRDQWREHFQQISNAQQANQIIGTRQIRYLNGGTTRIGQCDVSVYPLNRSDVPAVNLRVSNAGIRADELRQLAALLNEVADVLDS